MPLIVAGLTQLYFVQNFIKDTAAHYLEGKLGVPVSIGTFHMNGFSGLVLDDVRLEDKQHRTLFYSGSLHLRYDLLPLVRRQLVVYNLQWQDVRVDVYRQAHASAFNYQFILDAFPASGDTTGATPGASYYYRLDTIQLQGFQLRYHDSLTGTLASVAFDTIGLLPGELNFDSMRFALHDLYVDSLRADIRLPASADAGPGGGTGTAGKALFWLAAHRITLLDTRIRFDQGPEGFGTVDTLGALRIAGLTLDMSGNRILTDSLLLADASTAIRLGPSSDTVVATAPAADTNYAGYFIRGGWLSLRHTRFRMEVAGAPASPYPDAVDFNHLDVDSLDATLGDVVFDTDTLHGVVHHMALRERSGFRLRELRGRVWYDPSRLSLDELSLVTAYSRLTDTLEVSVPSWSTVSEHLNALALRLNLDSSVLDGRDARYFAPWLAEDASLRPLLTKRLNVDLRATGPLSALDIGHLSLSDGEGNLVCLKGRVLNAGLPDSLWADLVLEDIRTGDAPLRSWLAPGQLPPSVVLPDRIALSGTLAAGLQAVRTDLRIATSDGDAKLTANLADYLDSLRARYQVSFTLSDLACGKLAGDTLLGRITASGMVDGRGWAFPRMEDTARVHIASLRYNGYTYQDITLDGSYKPSRFSVQADSRDTAVRFVLKAHGSPDADKGYLDGTLSARRLDLYATHWTSSPFHTSFGLRTRLASLRPYHLRGELRVDSLMMTTDSATIRLDTIRLAARDSTEQQFITLDAPFGQLQARGHYDYTTIFSAISGMVSRHLRAADSLSGTAASPADSTASQDIDLTAALRWPRSLEPLLPGLSLESPARLMLHANTDSTLVSARWSVTGLHYGDFAVDSLTGSLLGGPDSLTAYTTVGSVGHPRFPLGQTRIDVAAAAGVLHTGLAIAGGDGSPKYRLGALIAPEPGGALAIRLDPGVLLNGQSWGVSDDNVIRLAAGQLQSGRLTLSRGDGQLRLATRPDSSTATAADLRFHDFRLSAVTSVLANDTALASGLVNGTVTAGDWQHDLRLATDLRIDSLAVMHAALGTLTLTAANTTPDDYDIRLGLKGNGNDVTLSGHYRAAAASPLDFRLQLQPLSLASLSPLARDYVTHLTGNLQGAVTVTGSTAKPSVLGELTFRDAAFNPTVINSNLRLYREKISFRPDGIHFDNFVLSDSANNEAVINGIIRTRDYARYFFDLDLQATDFEVLGPKQSGDQMLYGPAYVDSRITLRGTPSFPRVNMNLKLEGKSDVTFTVPESQPGIEDREGVIRFVDRDHPGDTAGSRPDARGRVAPQGYQFSGNLEVNPDAAIRIIIDPQNGDNLYVKGTATLNTTMDAGGNLLLTGQYQIQQGAYSLSLNQLIKRSFAIEKGSTITWEGEPTHAQVDITARYLAQAPAIDLVADQLTNVSPQMRTRYKQREPIEVYLIIKGEMMKPEISFRLDMPEDHQNDLEGVVYNRLKQINLIPSELNKQVMGLLVLNSFIPENPMDIVGNGSGGLEQSARQSVSKILSQQLNNLAAGLIKGVDLNFDLQSQQDYSSGTSRNTTQLNVGVSKHLFNDRLTVSVGNNFELADNSRQASGIAGNVSIAYALTKDGRYRLTAYRKDNNEEIIQGQVVETGVTFSLVMDYDTFREIFAKARKEQKLELRKQEKQKKKSSNK